jgi:predicted nucleic acid-binding Zn ribbon protein
MSLVKCHECGNEISTEAKFCPQCGAKNRKRKKSIIGRFFVTLLVLFSAFVLYLIFEPYLNPKIPDCNSIIGYKMFSRTFDKSPYAKNENLKAIDVKNSKDLSRSSKEEDRVCEVTFILNNGKEIAYIFTFEKNKNSGFYIQGTPK